MVGEQSDWFHLQLLAFNVQVGTVAGWLTLIAIITTALLFYKGGGSTALSSLETVNRVLEKRVHDLEGQLKIALLSITDLTAKTDISSAVKPLLDAAKLHETNAQQRSNDTLKVLDRIVVATQNGHPKPRDM